MVRKSTIASAALIIDQRAETVRTWRFQLQPILGALGTKGARDVELDLPEVHFLALFAALNKQSRTLAECAASTVAWRRTIDRIMSGQIGADDRSVYGIEATFPDGHLDRYEADGAEMLAAAMVELRDAAAIAVLNISEIVARVNVGWIVATQGPDAARASLLARLEGAPEADREAALRHLEAAIARILPPPRIRKVRASDQLEGDPDPVKVPGNLLIPGTPAPAKMPEKSPAKGGKVHA